MSHIYSRLRLMILAFLPCVCSVAYAKVFAVAAPTTEAEPIGQIPSKKAVNQLSIFNQSQKVISKSKASVSFMPTLLGIFINGKERDSLDVL